MILLDESLYPKQGTLTLYYWQFVEYHIRRVRENL